MAVTAVPVAYVDAAERLETGGIVGAQESAVVSSRIVSTIVAVGVRAETAFVLATSSSPSTPGTSPRTRVKRLPPPSQQTGRSRRPARNTPPAEAEHRLAAAWHTRITALHARNSATEQERDEADTRLATATARVAGARAAIEMVEANLTSARAAAGRQRRPSRIRHSAHPSTG